MSPYRHKVVLVQACGELDQIWSLADTGRVKHALCTKLLSVDVGWQDIACKRSVDMHCMQLAGVTVLTKIWYKYREVDSLVG